MAGAGIDRLKEFFRHEYVYGLFFPIRLWGLSGLLQPTPAFLRIHTPPFLGKRDSGGAPGFRAVIPGFQRLPESSKRDGLIPVLASFFTTRCHDSRGKVDQAHPALGPVLVLAAFSAGCEGLDPALGQQVFVRVRNWKGVREGCVSFHDTKLSKSMRNRYGKGLAGSVMFGRQAHTTCYQGQPRGHIGDGESGDP